MVTHMKDNFRAFYSILRVVYFCEKPSEILTKMISIPDICTYNRITNYWLKTLAGGQLW